MNKAIIIYGLPGSGKGTQANLLADKLGLIHFDTGKYLERIVHDPANKKNKIIRRERKNFDTGKLCTPSWILKITREESVRLSRTGWGVIFSGSPRTMFEAFGDSRNSGLIGILEKEFGKKNITIFFLRITPEISIKRNSGRRVCPTCGAIIISYVHKNPLCPICLSRLKRRTLDNPGVIRVRFKEYMERTAPILKKLKKCGYKIHEINGAMLPAKVFSAVFKYFKTR
ncbi:MAG: nucleoside monophosphate kinase [Patescibacteria group bacterium]